MSTTLLENISGSREIARETFVFEWPDQFKERLCFQRDLLKLFKDTRLFGDIIDKALADVEALIQEIDEIGGRGSFEIHIDIKPKQTL